MKYPELTTERTTQVFQLSAVLSALGAGLAALGIVRTGGAILAISASIFISIRYARGPRKRRIEIIAPLAICALMLVVALTLPHAK
jgi:O-antigen/teichoic acid export membrane protein